MIDITNSLPTDEQKELLKTGKYGLIKNSNNDKIRLYPSSSTIGNKYIFNNLSNASVSQPADGSTIYSFGIYYIDSNDYSTLRQYSYKLGFNNKMYYISEQPELKYINVGEKKYTIPKVEFIDITITDNNTEGTITDEQLTILQKADYNCIRVNNNEIYRLSDKGLTEGVWTYTHDCYNESGVTKYLNLTIDTKSFTITQNSSGAGFTPTAEQQAALDSGITADKVTTYDGYQTEINSKVSTTGSTAISGVFDFNYFDKGYINKKINQNSDVLHPALIVSLDDRHSSNKYNVLYAIVNKTVSGEILDKSLYLGADDEYDLKLKGKSKTPYYKKSGDTEYKSLALEPEIVDLGTITETSGTLTDEQLNILQSSNNNYISLNNEEYYLFDKGHTEGYLTYSHVGIENNIHYIKTITITISTKGWTLVVSNTSSGSSTAVHNIYITQENKSNNTKVRAAMTIINNSEEPITTLDQLKLYVKGSSKYNMCSGSVYAIGNPSRYYPIICIESISNELYIAYTNTYDYTSNTLKLTTDAVIEDLNYPSTT